MHHQWFIGKPPKIKIPGMEGCSVRIGSQIHNAVAFLGFPDRTAPGGIRCEGTGFFLHYKEQGYLITVRHVARVLDGSPFVMRVNKLNGAGAQLLDVDTSNWLFHPDPTVDIAAIQMPLTTGTGIDAHYFLEHDLITPDKMQDDEFDVGDFCYTVGLFRYIYGKQINFPLVHSGNIALMPPKGETIPVFNKETKTVEQVEGYLIESRAIEGASGSPVFARGTIKADLGLRDTKTMEKAVPLFGDSKFGLLGVYQGAWFLPPDATLADGLKIPNDVNVPVGIGVVVPAIKILEVLETDTMRKTSEDKSTAAQMTSVSAPTTAANPTHREDFKSLLTKAAKTPPQDD